MDRKPTEIRVDYSKGWISNEDGLLIPKGASPNLRDVELYLGKLRRSRGTAVFSVTELTGNPRAILDYTTVVLSTSYLICITDANVYKYASATGLFSLVSTYAGTSMRPIYTTISKDLLIVADGTAVVKKYDGTTWASLGGLTTPAVIRTGKVVLDFWSHLLLMNNTEAGTAVPYRVRWSDTGDPEQWTTGNTGFQDLTDPPGSIEAAGKIADRAYVYKERSIWEGIYVGYPRILIFSPVVDGMGIVAPDTLIKVSGVHAFLGNDAFYIFDGKTPLSISDDVNNMLFGYESLLTPNSINKSYAAYIEPIHEIWLAVPVLDSTVPNYIFRYNISKKSWWHKYYPKKVYCLGRSGWEEGVVATWADLAGDWTVQNWRWADPAEKTAFPITLLATVETSKGLVKKVNPDTASDEGTYQEAYWETPDYCPSILTRWVEYQVEARGTGSVELLYNTNGGEGTYTSLGTKAVTTEFSFLKWTFDLSKISMRFRVKWPSSEVLVRQQFARYMPHER